MLKSRKVKTTINDKEFEIYLLRVTVALGMAQKLSKVALPIVGEVFSGGEMSFDDIDFGKLATLAVDQLDELDFVELATTLLKEMTVDGGEVDFDTYFVGNYDELLAILTFAFKENFSSFFRSKGLLTK